MDYYPNSYLKESNHFHLYDEEKGTLVDLPNTSVKFSKLPKIPKNKKIKNINLVINIQKKTR